MECSVIITVLHESHIINTVIEHVHTIAGASEYEIIVVDGSPAHDTINAITDTRLKRLTSPPGRGCQMNAGANTARGRVYFSSTLILYFLPEHVN